MPSLAHEAPLVVLREDPALVPALLRESLGVDVPTFASVEVYDAGFTQALPAEFRADLVVHLRCGPPDHAPVMGIVVEILRAPDDAKRRLWPLHVAALHARLRCPTCLVVVATDRKTARWAEQPIATLQPGSPFVPLVLGPERVPRVTLERARHEPWLARAILLALADRHGAVSDDLHARVLACIDPDRLRALAVEVAGAVDHEGIERVLAALPPAAARDD